MQELLVERSYNKEYDLAMAVKQVKYQRKDSQSRRMDLIHAGIRCLSEGGMSGFTIDKISRQAAVSRGLTNHHFQSKDDLLVAIYEHMTAYLFKIETEGDAREHIVELINKSFDHSTSEKSNLRAWLAIWGEVATRAALKQLHQQRYQAYKLNLVAAITAVAKQHNRVLNAEAIARRLIALIDGLWLEYCLHSDGFSLEVARLDCYQFLKAQTGIHFD